jgi:pimeloyl-ACP methyl ester carboxylesterase
MRWLLRIVAGTATLLVIVYLGLVAYAYWPRDPGLPAEQLAGPADKFAELEWGSIRYRLYGDASPGRPEIVLIHGFANNLHSFRHLAPLLAENYRVLALDLQGFGLSSKPAEPAAYSYQAMADTVIATARAAGFSRPVYTGHSLGGVIALRAALADPQTFGIVFLDPGVYAGNALRKLTEFSVFPVPRLTALQFGDRKFRTSMIARSYRDSSILTDADVDNLMLAAKTNDYLQGMTTLLGYIPDGTEEIEMLRQVSAPVLAMWSASEARMPDNSTRLQNDIPNSTVVFVEEAGHYLHEEQPERVAAEMNLQIARWVQQDELSNENQGE